MVAVFFVMLRLELIRQLAVTFIISSSTTAGHKLLVLVCKIVEGHLAEEELLALVLDFHRQTTQAFVGVIHCQRLVLLPPIPMAHQDER